MKKRLKIIYVSALLAVLFGVRLKAQENVGAWPSVETGPVISQGIPVNVKVKTPEHMTAGPKQFARSSRFVAAGFTGNQVGPSIFRQGQSADRNRLESRRSDEETAPSGLTPPLLVSVPEAVPYPRKAIRRGWEGRVVLAYEVLPDGSVGHMEFVQSSGHELLDEAARESIKKWKFQPALKNDQPIKDIVETPVTFKLADQ
ncbi:MAG: energy transducer TonB [Candidatus Omnitrophota bacterium]